MARLVVHVTPKASRPGITGWRDGELQVRVSVAPEGGKANAETCRTIAAALGVPKSRVRLVRGETSRHKELEVEGVTDGEISAAFGESGTAMGDRS